MAILSREEILSKDDRVVEEVQVPEWGGSVLVRSLTGKERDAFEESLQETRGGKTKRNVKNFRARLVALCIVNEAGELVFSKADIDALGNKAAGALQAVFDKCNELSGLTEKDIDDLTEGFDEAGDEDSTSD